MRSHRIPTPIPTGSAARDLRRSPARGARVGVLLAGCAAALLVFCSTAFASAPAPAWYLTSTSIPTVLNPERTLAFGSAPLYNLTLTNIGAAASDGSQITVTDTLPAGVTAYAAGQPYTNPNTGGDDLACTGTGTATVTCTGSPVVAPGVAEQIMIYVSVAADAPAHGVNVVTVSGGGAAPATVSEPAAVSSAEPAPGFQQADVLMTNADGSPASQAGSHPYQLTTSFDLNSYVDPDGSLVVPGNPKDIVADLPAGLIGNPQSMPKCSQAAFETGGCPDSTAVGVADLRFWLTGYSAGDFQAIYNLQPPPGVPAQFGIDVDGAPFVQLNAGVRTGGDYGVTVSLINVPQDQELLGSTLTFWGDPADPSHDAMRGDLNVSGPGCLNAQTGFSAGSCPALVGQNLPLLTLPTSCGPAPTVFSADSWQDPGQYTSVSVPLEDASGKPYAIGDCGLLDFSPTLSIQPDTSVADSPSGLAVDLHVPQDGLLNPDGLAEANVKDARVTLPAGVSLDPSAANGLAACTPAEIGIDNANAPSCPDASKVGSVEVDSPLLPDPLEGGVYVAQQDQNPFGSLLAIYLTAYADGVWVKLAGDVAADPVTGQLVTTFSNNPQLPFTDFKLDFFGGPHGVLATPESCGTYTTTSDLSPWSGGPDATPSDSFTIDSGCVSGFSPSFTAGSSLRQAGAYTPFVVSFSRSDSDQNFSGLSVTLPPGMLANLSRVSECSDAQLAQAAASTGDQELASPSCPANSQVGTVQTAAGTGSDPIFVPGSAYLTGPYKGAPYGLAVVVPAVAGPYDLGTVVVRQALYVDPTTAQVTAVSDPFPTILQGIPLRIRRIDVDLDRPDFTVNPTSCDPLAITATLTSTGGLSAPVSTPFQVGGCQELAFSPRLAMSLTGRGRTRSGDHPNLISTLTQPFGQANLHDVKVALPLSLALDPINSQHVCNYDTAQAVHGGAVGCPADTIIGTATAVTPLLSQPLTGKVYLVQGIRFNKQGQRIRTLPSLLIPLRGQIALDLRAQSSVNGAQQLVTTFATIPDAAVSKFTLTITGGPKGILVITGRGRTICGKPQITNATLNAQSGKTETQNVTMNKPTCTGYHKPKKHTKSKAKKR
jgi:uncharacterized repeat protein (TIGR01451 family)